ncbi:type II toxin-antitoxin system HicB family antitoxin [Tychonema sp. LEGE 07203]|uniref:type II toxin-antitoxin system HicB family antitoxin n=1 Tax=Tychonema sp. LEGE 07203 TaxID=1828671 RepID=UPI00187F625F|nr:type II toxin-antitoxin system HicB family antitoxin [Tychonema sp. LEGE 07203]MBE9096452.1 type II toxin-antitoxin system HicB family antitoxin [Tychonema sp. LEGE 07203]
MNVSKSELYIIIEADEDGYYVGEVPQLKTCYSQRKTIDELIANIKELIALYLEEEGDRESPEFVAIQKVII